MFFFDSYALIEIIKGNERYKKYLKENIITTKLNLMEVYYYLLRVEDEDKAEHYYNFYLPATVPVKDDIIKNAMKFKLRYSYKNLSYVDCIGYILAIEFNIKFLTGDKEFKSLRNVEYVK